MQRPLIRLALAAVLLCGGAAHAQSTPAVDHHQHVFSEEIVKLLGPDSGLRPLQAKDLVPLLDATGVKKAVLLSTAYMYGSPQREVDREYARVRAKNDWTAAQAAQFPGRLIAFRRYLRVSSEMDSPASGESKTYENPVSINKSS